MSSISLSGVSKETVELRDKLAAKHGITKAEMDVWGYETGIKRQATLNKFNTTKGKAEKKAAKPAKAPTKVAAKGNGKANGHAKPKAAAKPAKKVAAKPAATEMIDDIE